MKLRVLPVLVFAFLFAACGDSPTSPSAHVTLGQSFELAPGAAAVIEDELLAVALDGVEGDSRCPLGVLCIHAGDALVKVRVRRLAQPGADFTLHAIGGPDSADYAGYRVSLQELTPHPIAGQAIAASDYRARLVVTRP